MFVFCLRTKRQKRQHCIACANVSISVSCSSYFADFVGLNLLAINSRWQQLIHTNHEHCPLIIKQHKYLFFKTNFKIRSNWPGLDRSLPGAPRNCGANNCIYLTIPLNAVSTRKMAQIKSHNYTLFKYNLWWLWYHLSPHLRPVLPTPTAADAILFGEPAGSK